LEESGLFLDSSEGKIPLLGMICVTARILKQSALSGLMDQSSTFEDSWVPIQPSGSSWTADDDFVKQKLSSSANKAGGSTLVGESEEKKNDQPTFNDSFAFWNGKK
jgi:hypothetical protein